MKERDVLRLVGRMLDLYGWRWWHVPAPMVAGKNEWRPFKKAAGLPDIFALHDDPPRMLILELKGDGGRLTADQREFLRMARDVAQDGLTTNLGVYVIGPENMDALEQMLRSKVIT